MSDLITSLFNVSRDHYDETNLAIADAARSGNRLALLKLGLKTVETDEGFAFLMSSGLKKAGDADPSARRDFYTWVSIISRRLARMTTEERLRLRDEICEAEAKKWAEAMKDKPLSCKKGCAFCCHIEVQVTRDEAEVLAGLVREGIVEIDRDRLGRQAALSDFEKGQTVKEAACVFLTSQNTCGVYEHRPMACRSYGVASPPQFCDTETYPDYDWIEVAVSNKIEVVQTAMRNAVHSGPLPNMLQKEFGRGRMPWDSRGWHPDDEARG